VEVILEDGACTSEGKKLCFLEESRRSEGLACQFQLDLTVRFGGQLGDHNGSVGDHFEDNFGGHFGGQF